MTIILGDSRLTPGCASELERCIKQSYPGQACWGGWGDAPPGKTCSTCCHFHRGKKLNPWHNPDGLCEKNTELMHGTKGPKIQPHAIACHYYEETAK